jgi:lipid A 3-O-deacylase
MRIDGCTRFRATCEILAGLLWIAATSPSAYAIDSVALGVGKSDGADLVRIAAQQNWQRTWTLRNFTVTAFWDYAVGYWRAEQLGEGKRDIIDVGVTPVFRLSYDKLDRVLPYLEAGIGVHLLSHTVNSEKIKLSTAFQFGDQIGAGLRFGPHYQYDLSYRFQHLSNASIKTPNDGANYHQLRFTYHFRDGAPALK